ncbi:uncharacterized protein ACA1_158160 [Acanthamoeba castellanii str. Neff]|uniref:Retrovirus-related Pol polyprotein from transposon TNT 1-94-like beta-barrel domain-containing protein n=1 Tax=Acanthamoeba castellanii (strain ATCC 30010 / Neff) TaxID=1257118 RepID=L8HA08_ACACF|nr:uncharacterized protein ACA1_158160 [Acanthamoeba castellanii str. Neff]ELR22062.1 hypothetical protein ACA1_158160 [Acanthamoeba castellanii str. Neff]
MTKCNKCSMEHRQDCCPKSERSSECALVTAKALEKEKKKYFALTVTTNKSWIANSGASSNFTYEHSVLHNYIPLPGDEYVYLGDNTRCRIRGRGLLHASTVVNSELIFLTIHNMFYVPNLAKNLLSIPTLVSEDREAIIDSSSCLLHNQQTSQPIFQATPHNRLLFMELDIKHIPTEVPQHVFTISAPAPTLQLLHCRFGHVGQKRLLGIAKALHVDSS